MTTAELQDNAEYIGRPVSPEYGKNPQNGKKEIRLFMEIIDGPLAGRRVKYVANTKDQKSTAYAKRDLAAAGWKGKDIGTFVADVTANVGAKLPFTVRLARNKRDDGTTSEWWTVGSIGSGAAPLAATNKDDDRDVNQWFAEVDVPPAGGASNSGGSNHPNAPGNGEPAPF